MQFEIRRIIIGCLGCGFELKNGDRRLHEFISSIVQVYSIIEWKMIF
jgi:hypothetical protein